ncbi:MAG: hypothetical protein QXP93_05555 [Nitrososphaerota archaeon]
MGSPSQSVYLDLARLSLKLRRADKRRREAASAMVRTIPRELRTMKPTLMTLLRKHADEFFEKYEEYERIKNEWKTKNKAVIDEFADAMREFFATTNSIIAVAEELDKNPEISPEAKKEVIETLAQIVESTA